MFIEKIFIKNPYRLRKTKPYSSNDAIPFNLILMYRDIHGSIEFHRMEKLSQSEIVSILDSLALTGQFQYGVTRIVEIDEDFCYCKLA